ncbi:neuronal acetylcholine receptor subunit alpha-6 [Patella vulgata]|uniref:neuronal acetylcholine receptor subunit alpha-6 n=1 Tax=Patella vulgata TaxID=6465 RepID=UPI00218065E7|nr:neuronal acetylcholine receptor subunit alpha-6 [Patella vulgata]
METDVYHSSKCLLVLLIICHLWWCSLASDTSVLPDEQRLSRKLFYNYDTSVRPVFNSSHSVIVTFNYNLIQVMDMDEKNQVLTLNAWLEWQWIDERMTWNPQDFNGLEVFRVPASKLWLPDILLYNNADDYTSGFMKCNVMILSNGLVLWSPPARLRSSCHIDITYFPFDSQVCSQKFGSWTYDKAQVDLRNKSNVLEVSNYITNGEWTLYKYTLVRNEVKYPIGDSVFPDVTIYITIYRRILYYVLNILLPCFWLNILSVLTFCLPPDAGEKLTLSITVLLSYSVFMLLVADTMPPTSESVPLIEVYLTMSMAMSSVSVIMTVLVLKLHHSPPNPTEVPNWVRFLILGVLAKIIQCKCSPRKDKKKSNPRSAINSNKYKEPEVTSNLIPEPTPYSRNSFSSDASRADDYTSNVDSRINRRSTSNQESSSEYRAHLYERSAYGMEELLKYLKLIVKKTDKEAEEEDLTDEWKQVALIVDRTMFYTFLFITLFSTLVILVLVPAASYVKSGGK